MKNPMILGQANVKHPTSFLENLRAMPVEIRLLLPSKLGSWPPWYADTGHFCRPSVPKRHH